MSGDLSTQSRDRTDKDLHPLVFETNASTNSAIWANVTAKVVIFSLIITVAALIFHFYFVSFRV